MSRERSQEAEMTAATGAGPDGSVVPGPAPVADAEAFVVDMDSRAFNWQQPDLPSPSVNQHKRSRSFSDIELDGALAHGVCGRAANSPDRGGSGQV